MARLLLLILCLSLTVCSPDRAIAQENGKLALTQGNSLPPQLVLVLRLVSATHVEPTTGIVISADGLVLVPVDFAGAGDEIVVLDGGTDIVRNGRSANIERRFFAEGLTAIRVQGLQRPAIELAALDPADLPEFTFAAFPPAEQIAQGAAPLRTPASLVYLEQSGRYSLAREQPLPNVTGAVLDSCGRVAALSSADGVQSMATDEVPRYHWQDNLLRIAAELGIDLPVRQCLPEQPEPVADEPVQDEPAEEQPPPPDPVEEPQVAQDPAQQDQAAEDETADAMAPDEEPPTEDDEAADGGPDVLPPLEDDSTADRQAAEAPPKDSPSWPWFLGAALLAGLALGIHFWRRKLSADPEDEPAAPAEPGTGTAELAVQGAVNPGLDCVLTLRGTAGDGSEFRRRCEVNSLDIDVSIGRSGTDIVIESASVSRRHARLRGSRARLFLSDLGSSNGTSINGVPCFEGEEFYVADDDRIMLGDIAVRVEIADRES